MRTCDCCGKSFSRGYHDIGRYYCSDRCLIWGNTPEGLSIPSYEFYDMFSWIKECENNDECYYTEWEENDEI